MSRAFAFGCGVYLSWAVVTHAGPSGFFVFAVVALAAAFFGGRRRAPSATATATAVSVASSDAQAAAVAQGGSVALHLHTYQPDGLDAAMGWDRSQLRPATDAAALEAAGITVVDGTPVLLGELDELRPVER